MMRHLLTLLLVVALVHLQFGCTHAVRETRLGFEVRTDENTRVVSLVTLAGEQIEFGELGGVRAVEHATGREVIAGFDQFGRSIAVPIDSVLEASVERIEQNVAGTAVLVVAGAAAAGFLAIIIALTINPPKSCPYIYSFDGERYVFDAQSYAGAVSQGLERADYGRLEHLRAIDGRYRLIMRNDPLDEQQFTDRIRLFAVDHPHGTVVSPGYDGRFHTLTSPRPPLSARDRDGRDILTFLRADDGVRWQTPMPADSSVFDGDLREHLSITFARPAAARTARLYVNAGTATWGSEMVGRFLDLHGSQVGAWYDAVDRGDRAALGLFKRIVDDEELYHLKVHVRTRDGWRVGGVIRTGGGLAQEDRTLELDLSDVEGDSLELRLDPPIGFWRIDHLALDVAAPGSAVVHELLPASISGDDTLDAVTLLSHEDGRRHALDLPREAVEVIFDAPPVAPGMQRSTFFMAEGWYRVETDRTRAPETATLQAIMTTPGAAHRHALGEYLEWRAEQLAARAGDRR